MSVSPVPQGYNSIIPNLVVRNATAAVEFYREAFDAEEVSIIVTPSGQLAHGELRIHGSIIMLAEEYAAQGLVGPQTSEGVSVSLLIYVNNVDLVYARAVAAGAEVLCPIENQFYGDRSGTVRDPFGHVWTIACRVETLTREEIQTRATEFFNKK